MYICICKSINEKKLKEFILKNNCSTSKEVSEKIGAGSECGKCIPEIDKIIIESNTR